MRTLFSKFLPTTYSKPRRIKAFDQERHSVTLSCELDLFKDVKNDADYHQRAIEAFCRVMDWPGSLLGGHTKEGMAWVFIDAFRTRDQGPAIEARRILKGRAKS